MKDKKKNINQSKCDSSVINVTLCFYLLSIFSLSSFVKNWEQNIIIKTLPPSVAGTREIIIILQNLHQASFVILFIYIETLNFTSIVCSYPSLSLLFRIYPLGGQNEILGIIEYFQEKLK